MSSKAEIESLPARVASVRERLLADGREEPKHLEVAQKRLPFVGSPRQVEVPSRLPDFGLLGFNIFPGGVQGDWPCNSAYGSLPQSGSPIYADATLAPGGEYEQLAQAFPMKGEIGLQGILGPGSTTGALVDQNLFIRVPLAVLVTPLDVPWVKHRSRIRFAADVQVSGYTEMAVADFVKPAGSGLIWLDLSLSVSSAVSGVDEIVAANSVRVVNREFDTAAGYDITPRRINQRFGLTAEVTDAFHYIDSLGVVDMAVKAALTISISDDANFYLGANFSGVSNGTADNGGIISVPEVAAFVYC